MIRTYILVERLAIAGPEIIMIYLWLSLASLKSVPYVFLHLI